MQLSRNRNGKGYDNGRHYSKHLQKDVVGLNHERKWQRANVTELKPMHHPEWLSERAVNKVVHNWSNCNYFTTYEITRLLMNKLFLPYYLACILSRHSCIIENERPDTLSFIIQYYNVKYAKVYIWISHLRDFTAGAKVRQKNIWWYNDSRAEI